MGAWSYCEIRMAISNINPVGRAERASAVRRESHSKQPRRRFQPPSLADDNPELVQPAETGTNSSDGDGYAPASDDESAILGRIDANALRWPAQVASDILPVRKEENGDHS